MNPFPNKELKDWIAKGYLRQAIAQMLDAIKASNSFPTLLFKEEFLNSVSLLSNRFIEMERKAQLGLISVDDYMLEHNRVAQACLDTLDRISDIIPLKHTPLSENLKKLKTVEAKDLNHQNFVLGDDNIIVQNTSNSSININVNKGANNSKLLRALLGVLILIPLLVGFIFFTKSQKVKAEFEEIANNGGYYEFKELKQNPGINDSILKAVNDSLKSKPAIIISGNWAPEASVDYEQLMFFRKDCRLFLKNSDGEILPCSIIGNEPSKWRVSFYNNNIQKTWRILFIGETSLLLKIGTQTIQFKRII